MKRLELREMIKKEIQMLSEGRFDGYHDFYVVTSDTRVGKQNLKAGTVIYSTAGGTYKNFKEGINGLKELQADPNVKRVSNPIWSESLDIANKLESFGRDVFKEVESNPKNAEKIVSEKQKILNQIKGLIK